MDALRVGAGERFWSWRHPTEEHLWVSTWWVSLAKLFLARLYLILLFFAKRYKLLAMARKTRFNSSPGVVGETRVNIFPLRGIVGEKKVKSQSHSRPCLANSHQTESLLKRECRPTVGHMDDLTIQVENSQVVVIRDFEQGKFLLAMRFEPSTF